MQVTQATLLLLLCGPHALTLSGCHAKLLYVRLSFLFHTEGKGKLGGGQETRLMQRRNWLKKKLNMAGMIPQYFAPSLYILCHFFNHNWFTCVWGRKDNKIHMTDVCCGSWCAMKCCWLWITDVACSRLHVVIKWHIHDPLPPGKLWKHTTSLLQVHHKWCS